MDVSHPTSAPPAALTLPAELTIYTVGELHPQWLAWLGTHTGAVDSSSSVCVQAAAVDQVDGAGLQLLLALQRSLTEHGRRLHIEAPSDVLRRGCEALGLCDWLQAQAVDAAATGGGDA